VDCAIDAVRKLTGILRVHLSRCAIDAVRKLTGILRVACAVRD
jgi:hypothetical protein